MAVRTVKLGGSDFSFGESPLNSADLNDTFDATTNLVKVSSIVVSGSDVTSVDFTGLDIDADGMYILVLELQNATAGDSHISLYINDDTTDGNYYKQQIRVNGGVISGARSNFGRCGQMIASLSATFIIEIIREKTSGYYVAFVRGLHNTGNSLMMEDCIIERAIDANITKISVVGLAGNSIKIGSVLSLYKVLR